MSDDTLPDVALKAALTINENVSTLWVAAHSAGVRNGIEGVAQFIDGTIKCLNEDLSIDSVMRDCITLTLSRISEQVRLTALFAEGW